MGYACPVCADPQADAEHLANHLAFTAMTRNDDHETWLDEHAPDWADSDAESLAAIVTDHAESVEFPQVFEDTVDRQSTSNQTQSGETTGHDHDHGRDPAEERSGALFDEEAAASRARTARDRELDDEAARIVEEAREMTEAMQEDEDEAETE